jgi:hypothetical protein
MRLLCPHAPRIDVPITLATFVAFARRLGGVCPARRGMVHEFERPGGEFSADSSTSVACEQIASPSLGDHPFRVPGGVLGERGDDGSDCFEGNFPRWEASAYCRITSSGPAVG